MSETRVLIERHRGPESCNYKLKYYLFSFQGGRVALPCGALREMEIIEGNDEVLSDIIIFDENSLHENYVIAIELIPIDDSVVDIPDREFVSISLFTFVEFEMVEFPFF